MTEPKTSLNPPESCTCGHRWFSLVWIMPLLALAFYFFATRDGVIGLSPDSRGYVMVAEHLSRGLGVTILNGDGNVAPLTWLAPLYGVALWPAAEFGIDPRKAAWILNAVLFALNAGVLGRLLEIVGGRSVITFLVGMSAAVSLPLLSIHAHLWSESLFLFFLLLTVVAFRRYALKPSLFWAIAIGVLCGYGYLTRYAGLALGATAVLAIFLLRGVELRRRFFHSILAGSCFAVFVAGWMIRNAYVSERSAVGRDPIRQLPPKSKLDDFFELVRDWILPERNMNGWIALGAGLGVGLLLALIGRRVASNEPAPARQSLIAWVYLFVYPVFLLFSLTFFDPATPIDDRILSPFYVCAAIVLVGLLGRNPQLNGSAPSLFTSTSNESVYASALGTSGVLSYEIPGAAKRSLWQAIAIVLLTGLLANQTRNSLDWARKAPHKYLHYANREWRNSPTRLAVQELPADMLIYSNGLDALYLLDDRFARPIPRLPDDKKANATRANYIKALKGMRDELVRTNGRVVLFERVQKARVAGGELMTKELGLIVERELSDGAILRLDPDAGPTKDTPADVRASLFGNPPAASHREAIERKNKK